MKVRGSNSLKVFCILKNWFSVGSKKRESILFQKMFQREQIGIAFVCRDNSTVTRVGRIWLEEWGPLLLSWKVSVLVSGRNYARKSNPRWFLLLPRCFSSLYPMYRSLRKQACMPLFCFTLNICFIATKYVTQCNSWRKARCRLANNCHVSIVILSQTLGAVGLEAV